MNSKNIIIGFGLIGVGFILYKLFVGILLPIAIFVVLGYALKAFLKGAKTNLSNDSSPIILNVFNKGRFLDF